MKPSKKAAPRKKRPKKTVHDLFWELIDAIEEVQLGWSALKEASMKSRDEMAWELFKDLASEDGSHPCDLVLQDRIEGAYRMTDAFLSAQGKTVEWWIEVLPGTGARRLNFNNGYAVVLDPDVADSILDGQQSVKLLVHSV